MSRRLRREDYTVGWICALPVELAAAQEMLDEEHEDLERDDDKNLYSLGSAAGHNVVIACLPAGRIGNNPAATVATQMRTTFKGIQFRLMVGIGAGVPSAEADIRLGDAVQYDIGKATPSGFERTGSLNSPPQILLSAVAKMRADELRGRNKLSKHVSKLNSISKFQRGRAGPDILFEATYDHEGGQTCDLCNSDRQEARQPRESDEVVVHYGTIASGNQVIRNGRMRDSVSRELGGILCFEMEAVGLINSFRCLIIRGVCDYADSHKNKSWQPYAAAMAAACAKGILLIIPAAEKAKTRIREPTEEYARLVRQIESQYHELANLEWEIRNLQKQHKNLFQQYQHLHQSEAKLLDLKVQLHEHELPPQLWWQKVVVLNDARGRSFPFFLELIDSAELFVEILKAKFKDLGLAKIKRGEWLLQDHYNGRILDLKKPWGALVRPGQMLDMAMIFRKQNVSFTHCPHCRSEIDGAPEIQKQCAQFLAMKTEMDMDDIFSSYDGAMDGWQDPYGDEVNFTMQRFLHLLNPSQTVFRRFQSTNHCEPSIISDLYTNDMDTVEEEEEEGLDEDYDINDFIEDSEENRGIPRQPRILDSAKRSRGLVDSSSPSYEDMEALLRAGGWILQHDGSDEKRDGHDYDFGGGTSERTVTASFFGGVRIPIRPPSRAESPKFMDEADDDSDLDQDPAPSPSAAETQNLAGPSLVNSWLCSIQPNQWGAFVTDRSSPSELRSRCSTETSSLGSYSDNIHDGINQPHEISSQSSRIDLRSQSPVAVGTAVAGQSAPCPTRFTPNEQEYLAGQLISDRMRVLREWRQAATNPVPTNPFAPGFRLPNPSSGVPPRNVTGPQQARSNSNESPNLGNSSATAQAIPSSLVLGQ
ncbi:purine and uridine phosphorylase [Periconia macrospinosa]|uniref:Purine and uridine phosphorylase n=1 Tax=Periconia macrospinosa TaxID=97972 RepID=A0A2V1D9T4_9PLEO|nr:purine and uridine phosphorylase [Periconia macrospinosa]